MTYRDKFDSERWLASSTLTGRWSYGNWMFRPSLSVAYLQDTSQSYSDAFGISIPEIRSRFGQAKAGPEFSYRYEASRNLLIEPRIGMHVVWDFASDVKAAGLTSLDAEGIGTGVRGRAEVGLRAQSSQGFSLDVSASYDGIGLGNYNAVSGRAVVRVPLN